MLRQSQGQLALARLGVRSLSQPAGQTLVVNGVTPTPLPVAAHQRPKFPVASSFGGISICAFRGSIVPAALLMYLQPMPTPQRGRHGGLVTAPRLLRPLIHETKTATRVDLLTRPTRATPRAGSPDDRSTWAGATTLSDPASSNDSRNTRLARRSLRERLRLLSKPSLLQNGPLRAPRWSKSQSRCLQQRRR
ncbi:hypothetical protein FA95DRAFT_568925 [Auriscalpium vulgare]|uniref:Uncharacterized protein n=1 Tax=Auriscalpium vulgare TaxID=40419 RepID=A0ACB8S361_9AGAM|nr:hypothetical protein FA95DRAFT_568925 [Auriscalpium vulgare]